MIKDENFYVIAMTYVVATSCLVLPFVGPTLMMGPQPYSATYLLLSMSFPVALFGVMATLTWDTMEKRQMRYFAFCGGVGWLLGVYPRGVGEVLGVGVLWMPLWNTIRVLLDNTAYPTYVEALLLLATLIAFLLMCWGFGGLFRKHTSRKDPFLTRGTTREGAKIQRSRWATPKETSQHLDEPGGIIIGEMTRANSSGVNEFKPGDRSTWGNHGKGQLLSISPKTGNGHVLVI